MSRKYGWKKDNEDHRDLYHCFNVSKMQETIQLVDLRPYCPKVYDQGHLGSCTANSIAGAYEFDEMKQKEDHAFTPSRLFIYYNERKMENTIDEDAGAMLRDGIKTINNDGVCPENMWEYDISKFTTEPSKEAYDSAKHHKCVEYKRVEQTLPQLKQCLIEGFPFIFGMMVYESFESMEVAKTGNVPMPKEDESLLGGHAVLCVGFDDTKKVFMVRNSWGEGWGDNGYFYLPYDFMKDSSLVSDIWTVRKVVDDDNEKNNSSRRYCNIM
jgi:C1A family cysteine protease